MADVIDPTGSFLSWDVTLCHGADPASARAYQRLILNLKRIPELKPPGEKSDIFLEEINGPGPSWVWQYYLPTGQLSTERIPFMDLSNPKRMFRREGPFLRPTRLCCPGPEVLLQRIIVGSPRSKPLLHFGIWQGDNPLIQYQWTDGTPLIDTSTSQLRLIQVHETAGPHVALRKWTVQLGRPILDDIWHLTWMSFRSAANTLLWKFLYHILSTQRWRMPGRSYADPEIWCLRCSLGIPEDTFHCIGVALYPAAAGIGEHLCCNWCPLVSQLHRRSGPGTSWWQKLSLPSGRCRHSFGTPCARSYVGSYGKTGMGMSLAENAQRFFGSLI